MVIQKTTLSVEANLLKVLNLYKIRNGFENLDAVIRAILPTDLSDELSNLDKEVRKNE